MIWFVSAIMFVIGVMTFGSATWYITVLLLLPGSMFLIGMFLRGPGQTIWYAVVETVPALVPPLPGKRTPVAQAPEAVEHERWEPETLPEGVPSLGEYRERRAAGAPVEQPAKRAVGQG